MFHLTLTRCFTQSKLEENTHWSYITWTAGVGPVDVLSVHAVKRCVWEYRLTILYFLTLSTSIKLQDGVGQVFNVSSTCRVTEPELTNFLRTCDHKCRLCFVGAHRMKCVVSGSE